MEIIIAIVVVHVERRQNGRQFLHRAVEILRGEGVTRVEAEAEEILTRDLVSDCT